MTSEHRTTETCNCQTVSDDYSDHMQSCPVWVAGKRARLARQKVRLTVLVAQFCDAAHVPGATTETIARTFDLPDEISRYILSNRGQWSTVTLAMDIQP